MGNNGERRRNSGISRLAGLLAAGLMLVKCSQPAPPATEAAEPARSSLPVPALLTASQADDRRLSTPAGLRAFFIALERIESGRSQGPVRILQIGDSHTANDAFSGRMREVLQARFGAAGRGWLPIGIPFKYFKPRLVSVTEAGWRHLGPADGAAGEAIGVDATVAVSDRHDAQMTLVSDEAEGFDQLAIEFLTQPDGGSLAVSVDRHSPILISTAAPTIRARRQAIPLVARAHAVELSATEGGPVHLTGWTAERRRVGVIYENHGTIGAKVTLLGRMSPVTLSYELSDSRPMLIVIAFGTNEGFDEQLDLQRYRVKFLDAVDGLHRKAPQAAILVLGPPDGNQIDKSCQGGDGRGVECRGGGGDPNGAAASCIWHEPSNLDAVRQIQRQVAAEKGWAFWDWSQAMGGICSMHRLFVRDPPLAYPDHVHLNKFGYAATADVLFFDLINEYQRWKKSRAGR
jgi:hypothetical protein